MNIATTKLPPLPQPPNGGRGSLKVDIDYSKADTVETRLGSIPADYDSWSGWEGRERIYFRDGNKEASNRYGRSVNIWRAQPTYNPDGSPRMKDVTETIVAKPKSSVTTPILWGAAGAAVGGLVGAIVGGLSGFSPGLSASVGAGLGVLGGGAFGYNDAQTDRVKLEWKETNITEKDLQGYIHDVDEERRYVCRGSGEDRRCRWEHDGYEHDFSPIVDRKVVGTYHRPVVVHYKDNS